ncbi:MAG: tRNA 2-thiouridine(34) synthase MnmA [Oscillospiraceae bacterium]|nr:tRNA 2-thiouridine(34) synthase MnmA [Oscillospiraceae bacterium]
MKALIAMSGGVDSSAAALLMQQAGYTCAGATMQLFHNEDAGIDREKTCCSLSDVLDAKQVCAKLSMLHYVFNFTDRFARDVMARFAACYDAGRTPNPCIDCNRYLKFDALLERALLMGYDLLVTGHYARVSYDAHTGRYLLHRAKDPSKDQSYVLYTLTQAQLSHIRFPLGDFTKQEVRQLAASHGFVNAKKADSQDICFVPDGDYAAFLTRFTGVPDIPGAFTSPDGTVLGQHRGIRHYTIGQRRGLGISAPHPLYVLDILPEEHRVIVGEHGALFTRELTAGDVNLISVPDLHEPMRVEAKIRYRHTAQPALAFQDANGRLHVEFDEPQRAVTPGQAVVLYDGDTVVGGGTIL